MGREKFVLQQHHGDQTHHALALPFHNLEPEQSVSTTVLSVSITALPNHPICWQFFPKTPGMQGLFSAVYDIRFESLNAQADMSH